MRYALILWSLALAGCDWSPERGNPYDPGSDRYIPPPVFNRPPVVKRPTVTTQCINNPLISQCGFTIRTRISDADNNLDLDAVDAYVYNPSSDTLSRYLGGLTYEPDSATWKLSREESELDSATERYVGAWISVIAVDDSGASHKDSVLFPQLYREYPAIRYPRDYSGAGGDCVCPDFHTFSWQRWNGEGQASDLELRFYFQNLNFVPSLTISGVSPQDTSVVAPLEFETADNNSFIFYGWRLFVRDQGGSIAGSESGTFHAFDQCPVDGCEP